MKQTLIVLLSSIRGTNTSTSTAQVNVVSSTNDIKGHRQSLASQRPTAPHMTIYKWPFAGIVSGTQRATGFAMVLGQFYYFIVLLFYFFIFVFLVECDIHSRKNIFLFGICLAFVCWDAILRQNQM